MGNYAYTGIQVHRCVSRARCQSKKVKWIIELSKLLCALCAERRLKRTKVPQISIEKKCAEHFFFFSNLNKPLRNTSLQTRECVWGLWPLQRLPTKIVKKNLYWFKLGIPNRCLSKLTNLSFFLHVNQP